MQVIGPAGEVLYLTQVNGVVPPFDIPRARCPVDRLMIPVSSCLRRDEGLAVYKKLGANKSWRVDTRIASVNKAHGLDVSMKHPVATVQLAGQSMVEIDQLGVAKSRPPTAGRLPAGIAMVSFVFDNMRIALRPECCSLFANTYRTNGMSDGVEGEYGRQWAVNIGLKGLYFQTNAGAFFYLHMGVGGGNAEQNGLPQ
jgi:hypothetical protein